MSGVSKIEIHETSEQLLSLIKQQKMLPLRDRVHALYLLKSKEAQSIAHAARLLGHNRVTVQRWLSEYQHGLDQSARVEGAWRSPCFNSTLGANQTEEAFAAA